MACRCRTLAWTLALVLPVAAGLSGAATAATLAPTTFRFSTIRIEPPRPGGLPGTPREIAPWRDLGADSTPIDKPIPKSKRRP